MVVTVFVVVKENDDVSKRSKDIECARKQKIEQRQKSGLCQCYSQMMNYHMDKGDMCPGPWSQLHSVVSGSMFINVHCFWFFMSWELRIQHELRSRMKLWQCDDFSSNDIRSSRIFFPAGLCGHMFFSSTWDISVQGLFERPSLISQNNRYNSKAICPMLF